MDRIEKEQQVSELKEKLQNSSFLILCDYRGLDVPAVTNLRQSFLKEECEYLVCKNTLLKRAISGSQAEKIAPLLEGPTAIIFNWGHPASSAKILRDFLKDQKTLQIKGGYLDGRVLNQKEVEAVADMPSKDQIRGEFLAMLNAASTNLLRTFNAGAQHFVYLLDAAKREKEK